MSYKQKKKDDVLENRMSLENHRKKISDEKLLMGATKNKYPIVLDDGKTTIFISDLSKEKEIRERYQLMSDGRINPQLRKAHS